MIRFSLNWKHIKELYEFDQNTKELIRLSAQNNTKYKNLLLEKAKESVKLNEYLIQEIDFSEKLHLLNIGVEDILKIA